MKSTKIIRELERRGLEFRGEYSAENAKSLNIASNGELDYSKNYEGINSFLFFAKRKAQEGCKVGDAGTECEDILISVDETDDDTKCHKVYKHSWFVPEMYSEEKPDGVYSLELDDDCHIIYCSHICGCCSTTGYHLDEVMQWTEEDTPKTAFDAIASTNINERLDLLLETCTPCHVRRFGYRD